MSNPTREEVRAFINKMEVSIADNPFLFIYKGVEMTTIERLVCNKKNPLWLDQPSRGRRGCDRFIMEWKHYLEWDEGDYRGGETISGFMDDFGSWIPFGEWPLLVE